MGGTRLYIRGKRMTEYKCIKCGAVWVELVGPKIKGDYICVQCRLEGKG